MHNLLKTIWLIFLVLTLAEVHAEGTKQILPNPLYKGQLCINKFRNDFGFYGAAPDFRINIHIANIGETINYGFGNVISTVSTTNMEYRIKDPKGAIVVGSDPIPTNAPGYISTYTQAYNGPFPALNGYTPLTYTPLITGDYVLEFYYPTPYTDVGSRKLEYFDITVEDAGGNAINGRVWSKAWQFWSEDPNAPPNDNRFYAKLMILSDDSIVTQVDCNGSIGGTFSFASNSTGCSNTGDITNDRASRNGFYILPQFRVFLNDPDSNIYPTAKLRAGITKVEVDTNCLTGGFEIKIKAIKDGNVEILIEVNPNPGADPQDVKIIAHVVANPGGDGFNVVQWNGLDNVLNPVANGTKIKISASYLSGLTHLPIYDIEYNDRGYIVSQVRPTGGQMNIYWDDSRIAGGMNVVTGCASPTGCHAWTDYFGNNKTINSWWYVANISISADDKQSTRKPATPSMIAGSAVYCMGSPPQQYSVPADPNSESYFWTYSGSGVSLVPDINKVTLQFSDAATSGDLEVRGHNKSCQDGKPVSLHVKIDYPPVVTLNTLTDICYTADTITLYGGDPSGGIYKVDGVVSEEFYAYLEEIGDHQITYIYRKPETGCSDSASAQLLVRRGEDCEASLIFPNAFTPNNDGLNDTFRPYGAVIYKYSMEIYNRFGQLIYSTNDGRMGWDGTSNGKPCPAGVYVFMASYDLSLREDNTGRSRGKVTLLR